MTSPEALAAARECASQVFHMLTNCGRPSFSASEAALIIDTIDRHFAPLRAERDALALRCAAMEKALTRFAVEHEDQARAWKEGGESDHSKYHAKWGKVARAALSRLNESAQVQT